MSFDTAATPDRAVSASGSKARQRRWRACASIVADPRHEFVTVLVDRPQPPLPPTEPWQAGYCGPEELDLLVGPERQDRANADQAMAIFRSIVTRSDLSP